MIYCLRASEPEEIGTILAKSMALATLHSTTLHRLGARGIFEVREKNTCALRQLHGHVEQATLPREEHCTGRLVLGHQQHAEDQSLGLTIQTAFSMWPQPGSRGLTSAPHFVT